MIYVENKKRKIEKLKEQYPDAIILDITSTAETKYAQWLSPFYPHGHIPIPFTDPTKLTATCVEAVWQGLKVFEGAGVDFDTFRNDTMHDIKRSVRRFGPPKGHQTGAFGTELLNYFDARMLIYLPTYKYVLDNVPYVHKVVMRIAEKAKEQDIVFLDYNTNTDVRDISKPISHAGLVKLYIEGAYPDASDNLRPLSPEELEQKKASKKKPEKRTANKEERLKQLSLIEQKL